MCGHGETGQGQTAVCEAENDHVEPTMVDQTTIGMNDGCSGFGSKGHDVDIENDALRNGERAPSNVTEMLDEQRDAVYDSDGTGSSCDADSMPGLEADSSDDESPEDNRAVPAPKAESLRASLEGTGLRPSRREGVQDERRSLPAALWPAKGDQRGDSDGTKTSPHMAGCGDQCGPSVDGPTDNAANACASGDRRYRPTREKWKMTGHQLWRTTQTPLGSVYEEARRSTQEARGEPRADPAKAEGTCVPLGHRRIGEAANPGPLQGEGEDHARGAAEPPAAWTEATMGCLRYPEPFKPGLNNVLTPGYLVDEDGDDGTDHEMALSIETANTTGWKPLRRRLLATRAHVVLAQETRISGEKMNQASQWALRKGWKMIATEAVCGPKGGSSAGAAIFARAELGLRLPPKGNNVVTEGRTVTAVVDAPGYRPTLLASVYLHHGQGLSTENRGILAALAGHVEAQGERWQVVVGGDFNVEPTEIADSELHERLGMTIVYPAGRRGTCRTRTTKRVYDFFLVSAPLATAVGDVKTIEGSNIKTHTPVSITFKPRAISLKHLRLAKPEPLPKERVYGPLLPPPDWREAKEAAERAVREARSGRTNKTLEMLDDAYEAFARTAEGELRHTTGAQGHRKTGQRGTRPRVQWKSVVPEVKPKEDQPITSALNWMTGIYRELRRVTFAATEGTTDEGAAATNGHGTPEEFSDGKGGHQGDADDGDDWSDMGDGCISELLNELELAIITDFPTQIENIEIIREHTALITEAAATREAINVGGDRLKEQAEKLDEAVSEMTKKTNAQEAKDEAYYVDQWKQWIRQGADKGARNAHRFSRAPQPWVPTTAGEESSGTLTGDPAAALEELRQKYIGRWKPSEAPRFPAHEPVTPLPRISAASVADAGSSFTWDTASTYDGFHPRHFGMLSEQGCETAAALMEAMELSARLPSQLQLIVMPTLPKPQGGFRAIGMMPSLYRVWARCRKDIAQKWESENCRGYWSADAGNGAIDTVWRQEARRESRIAKGDQAAAMIVDLEAFFETIDRDLLRERARQANFPLAILDLCLATYAGPRMLSMGGIIAKEVYPTRGIVAGCGMATTLVKLYCRDPFDTFVEKLPKDLHFDAHVDDLVISGEGAPSRLVEEMAEIEGHLHGMILHDLKGTVAEGKAAVVATSRELTKRLRQKIPRITGPVRMCMMNLGVDCTAGRKRGTRAGRLKLSMRIKLGCKRAPRLKALHGIIKRRALTIFTVGVAPKMAYGAEVRGLTDDDIIRIRRTAAAAMSPHARNASLSMKTLLHDIPSARVELAPALQYARMCWWAKTRPTDARRRGAALTDIRGWYENVSNEQHARWEDSYGVGDEMGKLGRSRTREAWSLTRGPIGAMALTLRRIGWKSVGPFAWLDDKGIEHVLTAATPAAIGELLKEGLRRSIERRVGRNWADGDETFSGGRRICADLAERLFRCPCPGDLTPHQRGAFKSAVANALMTNCRAHEGGYDVTRMCPLCNEAEDTVHHRVYGCRCTMDVLDRALPKWFLSEARKASASERFWTTGVFPHPDDVYPLPATQDKMIMLCGEGVDEYEGPGLGGSTGFIFTDGSCLTSPIRGLARAGGSATEVDENGIMMRQLLMPVPPTIKQSPQSGEYVGYFGAVSQLQRSTIIFTDCQGMRDAVTGHEHRARDGRRKQAGIVMSAHARPELRRMVKEVKWIKAHRKEEQAIDQDDLWRIKGNNAADEGARRAADLHPKPTAEEAARTEFYIKRFPLVARAVGLALELFPPAGGKLKRRPPPANRDQALERGCHVWEAAPGGWRCELCRTRCGRAKIPLYRRHQKCQGQREDIVAHEYADRGHQIRTAFGNPPFVFCAKCGGTSLKRAYKLAEACRQPNASGRSALNRIARGLHPWRRKNGADGKEEARTTITQGAAYDASERQWIMDGVRRNSIGILIRDRKTRCRARKEGEQRGTPGDEQRGADDDKTQEQPEMETLPTDGLTMCEQASDVPIPSDDDLDHDVFEFGGGFDNVANGTDAESERAADTVREQTEQGNESGALRGVSSGRCMIINGWSTSDPVRTIAKAYYGPDQDTFRAAEGNGDGWTICHPIEIAKARREGRYSIHLAERDIVLVITSEKAADETFAAAKAMRTMCAQCGGDTPFDQANKMRRCRHAICDACKRENAGNYGDTERETACPRCAYETQRNKRPAIETWHAADVNSWIHNHVFDAFRKEERKVKARLLAEPNGATAADGPPQDKEGPVNRAKGTAAERIEELRKRVRERSRGDGGGPPRAVDRYVAAGSSWEESQPSNRPHARNVYSDAETGTPSGARGSGEDREVPNGGRGPPGTSVRADEDTDPKGRLHLGVPCVATKLGNVNEAGKEADDERNAEVKAAPATPIAHPEERVRANGDMNPARSSKTIWCVTGCGCNGRLHFQCARYPQREDSNATAGRAKRKPSDDEIGPTPVEPARRRVRIRGKQRVAQSFGGHEASNKEETNQGQHYQGELRHPEATHGERQRTNGVAHDLANRRGGNETEEQTVASEVPLIYSDAWSHEGDSRNPMNNDLQDKGDAEDNAAGRGMGPPDSGSSGTCRREREESGGGRCGSGSVKNTGCSDGRQQGPCDGGERGRCNRYPEEGQRTRQCSRDDDRADAGCDKGSTGGPNAEECREAISNADGKDDLDGFDDGRLDGTHDLNNLDDKVLRESMCTPGSDVSAALRRECVKPREEAGGDGEGSDVTDACRSVCVKPEHTARYGVIPGSDVSSAHRQECVNPRWISCGDSDGSDVTGAHRPVCVYPRRIANKQGREATGAKGTDAQISDDYHPKLDDLHYLHFQTGNFDEDEAKRTVLGSDVPVARRPGCVNTRLTRGYGGDGSDVTGARRPVCVDSRRAVAERVKNKAARPTSAENESEDLGFKHCGVDYTYYQDGYWDDHRDLRYDEEEYTVNERLPGSDVSLVAHQECVKPRSSEASGGDEGSADESSTTARAGGSKDYVFKKDPAEDQAFDETRTVKKLGRRPTAGSGQTIGGGGAATKRNHYNEDETTETVSAADVDLQRAPKKQRSQRTASSTTQGPCPLADAHDEERFGDGGTLGEERSVHGLEELCEGLLRDGACRVQPKSHAEVGSSLYDACPGDRRMKRSRREANLAEVHGRRRARPAAERAGEQPGDAAHTSDTARPPGGTCTLLDELGDETTYG